MTSYRDRKGVLGGLCLYDQLQRQEEGFGGNRKGGFGGTVLV